MSLKLAHRRKISAKRNGRWFTKHTFSHLGDPLFYKQRGTGKNKSHTVVIGIASQSGSGRSIFSELAELGELDHKDRIQQVLNHGIFSMRIVSDTKKRKSI